MKKVLMISLLAIFGSYITASTQATKDKKHALMVSDVKGWNIVGETTPAGESFLFFMNQFSFKS